MDREKIAEERRRSERQDLPVEVHFKDKDAMERELAGNISHGGMFIVTDELREIRSTIDLEIYLPNLNEPLRLKAEVVHVQDSTSPHGAGMGVQFLDTTEEIRKKLDGFFQLVRKAEALGQVNRAILENVESVSQKAYLEQLSLSEKIRLALHGGREIRQLLLKDRQPVVHRYVLRNEKITTEEVVKLAGNPTTRSDLIIAILKKPEWLGNPMIKSALARHPKIPLPQLQKILSSLPVSELKVLARGDSGRAQVANLARKELAKRRVL